MELLNTPDPTFQPTETKLEESERRKREAKEAHEKRLQEGLEKCMFCIVSTFKEFTFNQITNNSVLLGDPKNDPLVKGDPFQTLFIARLAHDVTEKDLDDELSKYGRVERVSINN